MSKISSIQITFAAPVELTAEAESALQFIVGKICEGYERANPDRVMWLAGYGSLPLNIWDDDKLDFDESVLSMDCCERERYETDRKCQDGEGR